MLSANQIKYIRSLHNKKGRKENKSFIVEGPKLVNEVLQSGYSVSWLGGVNNSGYENESFTLISDKDLSRISCLKTPNTVLAVVDFNTPLSPISFKNKRTLVLDNINDPGNLGTIIRTADWFGFDQLICSETSTDMYSPKVIQSTMGSIFRMPVIYANLPEVLNAVSVPVYAADMEGVNVYEQAFEDACVLIMGSESHGISKELESVITQRITIPQFGKAESLNVATACGIICSEMRR